MFFLFILIIIFVLLMAIHTSRIGIQIENLNIDTEKAKKIAEGYRIYLIIYIFKKIKIFKKNINIKNLKFQANDIDVRFLKNMGFKVNYKELLKNINVEVKEINLEAEIGTEDAALTAIIVGVLSGVIGVLVRKPKYKIVPVYKNKNLLKIRLEGIFTVYLMHHIYNQIFKIKRRVNKNERASNRKSYDDCYE